MFAQWQAPLANAQGCALGVGTEPQSSQIRFPPMLIADGASISGASPKMLGIGRGSEGRRLAYESARMEGISF